MRARRDASFAEICGASAVEVADEAVGDGARLGRLAVCTLAGASGGAAGAGTGRAGARYIRKAGVDWDCAFSDVGSAIARDASRAAAFGVSGIECADVREGRREGRSVVFQLGCVQSDRGRSGAGMVSLAVFSRQDGS